MLFESMIENKLGVCVFVCVCGFLFVCNVHILLSPRFKVLIIIEFEAFVR